MAHKTGRRKSISSLQSMQPDPGEPSRSQLTNRRPTPIHSTVPPRSGLVQGWVDDPRNRPHLAVGSGTVPNCSDRPFSRTPSERRKSYGKMGPKSVQVRRSKIGGFSGLSRTRALRRVFDTTTGCEQRLKLSATRRPLGCFRPSDRFAGWVWLLPAGAPRRQVGITPTGNCRLSRHTSAYSFDGTFLGM